MANVTILIPTYFGGSMLFNCLQSIHTNVPNAKVLVYKNDEGWLKACNHLMQSTNDDVILLNDDTIVLTDIVAAMQKELGWLYKKRVGIVGGKSLMVNEETILNYGVYIGTDGNTAHKHYGQPRDSVKFEIQKAVEGSCMYISRELLNEIGFFDEGFGMGYREEIDLCLRAREAGWEVVSTPKAEYVHFTNQTHGRLGIHNDKYDYFMKKWGSKLKLGKV